MLPGRPSSPELPGAADAACGYQCPAGAPPRTMWIAPWPRRKGRCRWEWNREPELCRLAHMTCLEAGDHLPGSVQQLEPLSGDPPLFHSAEGVQKVSLGFHALRTG